MVQIRSLTVRCTHQVQCFLVRLIRRLTAHLGAKCMRTDCTEGYSLVCLFLQNVLMDFRSRVNSRRHSCSYIWFHALYVPEAFCAGSVTDARFRLVHSSPTNNFSATRAPSVGKPCTLYRLFSKKIIFRKSATKKSERYLSIVGNV